MEWLEERTLLATLPAATVSAQMNLNTLLNESQNEGAPSDTYSTPTIVVDPSNAQDLAAVWIKTQATGTTLPSFNSGGTQMTSIIEGAFSTNGGTSWTKIAAIPANQFVQTDLSVSQTNGFVGYNEVTDPSIAFDGSHDLYLTYSVHDATYAGGAIELERFNFNSAAPSIVNLGGANNYQVLYQWDGAQGSGPAFTPALAVDTSPAALPQPLGINIGPSGDVFVSTPSGNRVMQFSPTTGALLNVYATTNMLSPQYQAFNATNSELYVPNAANSTVTAYNNIASAPPTSSVAAGFNIKGDTLSVPKGEAYGSDGNLYVANSAGNDVLEYDGFSGAFIKDFVAPNDHNLTSPDGLTFDAGGNLYVSSSQNNLVLEYSAGGAFVQVTNGGGGLLNTPGSTWRSTTRHSRRAQAICSLPIRAHTPPPRHCRSRRPRPVVTAFPC